MTTETYEQRVSVRLANVPMRFIRRPVSVLPPDGTHCIVDDGPRIGSCTRRAAAIYLLGKWTGVKWEPTHWMTPDD